MLAHAHHKEPIMPEERFIPVSRPSRAEGIGQALQIAFRDGFDLPADMQACVDRLNRMSM